MEPYETVVFVTGDNYILFVEAETRLQLLLEGVAWICRMLNSSVPAYLFLLQDTWYTCYSPRKCSVSNPLAVRPVQGIQVLYTVH